MEKAGARRGQVLLIIAVGLVALIVLAGLAVDGWNVYSDGRRAQNSVESAALAAGEAQIRGEDAKTGAAANAKSHGYNNNGDTNTVSVSTAASPAGACAGGAAGHDIRVDITSHVSMYLGQVVGVPRMTNYVSATARVCAAYRVPLFNGAALVALTPTGTGFNAGESSQWNITGGGVFSESADSASVLCSGDGGVTAPSISTVGGTSLTCPHVDVGTTTKGVPQLTPAAYVSLFPPRPACDGTAAKSGGIWSPQSGAHGSNVAFDGNMKFAPGLYCVTNSPGPFRGTITGNGVTFFIVPTNFNLQFDDGGSIAAAAPALPEDYLGASRYLGVLIFSEPRFVGDVLQQSQSIALVGSGTQDVVGSVILPSGTVTVIGNSGTARWSTQVIAHDIVGGGNAEISIDYKAESNYQLLYPASLRVLK